MKANLVKIKSNHNNIKDRYEGQPNELPKLGERFVLFHDGGSRMLVTTPVTLVNKLSDKVIEFETKNSKYSLELVGE